MSIDTIAGALFGTDEPRGEPLLLRTGPLELTFQGGRLHSLCVDGVEVWRGILFLYRDPDWGTPAVSLANLTHESQGNRFRLSFDARCASQPEISWRASIESRADGQVRFEAEARPLADLPTSRTGICVLHPRQAAGTALEVVHADGRVSRSSFPQLISPWQPFTQIRSLRHEFAPGCWAHCAFEGDTFEMEDQRNFSDASFKTYSRSNFMPRPYLLRAGVPIRQAVELRIEAHSRGSVRVARAASPVSIEVKSMVNTRMPSLGTAIRGADGACALGVQNVLARLGLDFLHLSLDAAEPSVRAIDWSAIARLLAGTGTGLRLDLKAEANKPVGAAIDALVRALEAAQIVPESIAAFSGDTALFALARAAFPGAALGDGTPAYFTQLNRMSVDPAADFLTFCTTPIVHVADDLSVMQTLETLPDMVASLRARFGARPFRVGPSAISMRDNPFGAQPPSDGNLRLAMARRDPRSRGLFGAAWLLGYAARFAYAGAEAISVMEAVGDAGLVEATDDAEVRLVPAYHALRAFGATRGCGLLAIVNSDPGRVAALAVVSGDPTRGPTLLLANLGDAPTDIEVSTASWPAAPRLRILDARQCLAASRDADWWEKCESTRLDRPRFSIGPYALARLDAG